MFPNKTIRDELAQYKYKIELHCHTSPASPCADFSPEDVIATYKELGYDGVVITNHYNLDNSTAYPTEEAYLDTFFDDYARACKAGEALGITVCFGLELRFPENFNDYLVYGIDPEEARKLFPYVRDGSFEDFRKNYKGDYVLVQAHPYRDHMIPADKALLDGVELMNLHPNHNSRIGITAKMAREIDGIVTSGSDFHHPGQAGLGGMFTKVLPRDTKAVRDILRSGDYLLNLGGYPAIPAILK